MIEIHVEKNRRLDTFGIIWNMLYKLYLLKKKKKNNNHDPLFNPLITKSILEFIILFFKFKSSEYCMYGANKNYLIYK